MTTSAFGIEHGDLAKGHKTNVALGAAGGAALGGALYVGTRGHVAGTQKVVADAAKVSRKKVGLGVAGALGVGAVGAKLASAMRKVPEGVHTGEDVAQGARRYSGAHRAAA